MAEFMIVCTFLEGTDMAEVFGVVAEDEHEAAATVRSLPMATWWDIDAFPIAAPVIQGDR